ncbi:MAG: peroxiredoxin [Rhizobiaceae bacterium]
MVNIGDKAPPFELPSNGEGTIKIPGGKPTVLFFYPKDDTPGCTTEAKGFSALQKNFEKLGVEIVGLSPDKVAKHDKFVAKHELSVPLVSDEEHVALQAYGVWVEKSMYGRTYMGVERSTYLIAADGVILEAWRKVRVKGHVEAVLEAAKQHFG